MTPNIQISLWVILLYDCFPFQSTPKNLDPSYKKDQHVWDCFAEKKMVLQPKE